MTFMMTRGATPATPSATDVALEASVTQDRATALIAASWSLVETFTGRTYWPVTAAVLVTETPASDTPQSGVAAWPREPFPADVEIQKWTAGAWAADAGADYVPDLGLSILLEPGARYRIAQVGTVTPAAPGANVVEAVRALALYQLIHSPARREFRAMTAGDSSLTREALDGLFRASGAGILLAGEVRF
jgi:hypothetical protein